MERSRASLSALTVAIALISGAPLIGEARGTVTVGEKTLTLVLAQTCGPKPADRRCMTWVCTGGTWDLFASTAGTACDDGDPCTYGDTCDGGGRCAATRISCSPCEYCNGTSTCQRYPSRTPCPGANSSSNPCELFCDGVSPYCQPFCNPTTCAEQGASCGTIPDGCGGTPLGCGNCPPGQMCNSSNVCVCQPTTCAAQGKNCGTIPDGCGGTLSCGTCAAGTSCGATNVCVACSPPTCGGACNTTVTACGTTITCSCAAGSVCNANICQRATNCPPGLKDCNGDGSFCSKVCK